MLRFGVAQPGVLALEPVKPRLELRTVLVNPTGDDRQPLAYVLKREGDGFGLHAVPPYGYELDRDECRGL